ncbi:DUF1684 domain-containing protein [Kaistella jeonii]|uniref:DUF1684 domain-containing protein n=1 Tax=Kaistella jeonii TaxID=266749 RepID=A0A0C1F5H4_9FLAO|nr:DUF1684 domain-containing protein [Kaistella jeonii]KIA88462.1 hypothetical protein OA86_10515 [Kaistella jeonii]SFC17623.1 hypothetical protein SAMN05421876_10865 [Kaistella jeonii]VEI95429.1 Protein of uncharacterised function (DUF1684) [Kaistella jeonii]
MKPRQILVLFTLLIFSFSQAQKKEISEIKKFQKELNAEYKNPKETPLRGSNFTNFKRHPFFPIDLKYRVKAIFTKSENAIAFKLPTSSGRTQPYIEFGKATFNLDGKTYTLSIYQSLNLSKKEGFEDYLFLPFRDVTNGKETYGGGKYLDLRIPKAGEIIIDFNQSYQPFCAYNAYDYNCPIVPKENFLLIKIKAGVKYEDTYHH